MLRALRAAASPQPCAIVAGRAEVQNSPFYHLIFATQELVEATDAAEAAPRFEVWKTAISSCRKELGQVRLGMETTGVSADLVLDLRSIELALMRMHGLARVLSYERCAGGWCG